ncbi:engulfment and cell motility ELM family protein [Heterostelium album PN500]|uniref:Engulfment and cell motility ELM family protein n=1 Tax=Heterostelium pallidum (strain ATCC 26659 / Pp 5 / PN500) TaxID=670386 RepID=D3BSV8_HETP5|nr:engulfment and cell motility ELM family protein [Heterostelium album PN500]EFA75573.1 engulfment and cell motility ELM family protein [Heterostelium album PN500]|eukprot:XP_020427707.1 engulfment and cell motility ELM family protein [Heterostelium album PN500]
MTDEDPVNVEPMNVGLHGGLAGLKQQIEASDDSSQSETDQSVDMLTTAVVSFVFVSKQASLFNLLIQMLSTNKFAPVQNQFNIPFQPSPDPSVVIPAHQESLNSSTGSSSPKTSALMFNVLNDAINSVSQQYQKNFYINIIERTDNNNPSYNQLLAGCLSFINHMLSAAPTHFDFERYRQQLSAQGVNDIIKKQIKNVDPNVRSELLHYQKHKIANIKTGKLIIDKQSIDHLVTRLLKVSFPNKTFDEPTSSSNGNTSTEQKMKILGFQSGATTGSISNTELLGTGILGLRNLIYFGARYSRIYLEILNVQMKRDQEEAIYSFINVAMCLTNCIYEIYIDDENLYEVIFDQDDWFEEMFSISFELFDEIWEKEAKVPEDFVTILHKTRNILSRIKWTNQDSIQSFQIALGTVLDEIWNREDEIVEDQHRRLMPLSDSIIGLPHGHGGGSGSGNGKSHEHSNLTHATQRFQKFFKSRKDSNDEIGLNSSSGSIASNVDSAPPSPSLQGSTESSNNNNATTGGRKVTHIRHHMKSMSFKKLFEFKDKNPNGGATLNQSQEIPRVDTDDEESRETQIKEKDLSNEEEKKSFERIIKVLKNTAATLKHKQSGDKSTATKIDTSALAQQQQAEVKSDSLDVVIVSSQSSSSSLNQELDQQTTVAISTDENGQHFQFDDVQSINSSQTSSPKMNTSDKLKASGSVMYKTVKKVMHSIEKKGKTIKKKVKKRRALSDQQMQAEMTEEERAAKLEKKLKKKQRRKMKNVQYEKENDTIVLQVSNESINGQKKVDRGSFQELNLDLDDQSDSLDSSDDSEDSDDESGTTVDDLTDNQSERHHGLAIPKLKISNNMTKSDSNSSINTQTSNSTCVSPKEYPISYSNSSSSNDLLKQQPKQQQQHRQQQQQVQEPPSPLLLTPKSTTSDSQLQPPQQTLLSPDATTTENTGNRRSVKDIKDVFDALDELSKGYVSASTTPVSSSTEHSTVNTPRSSLSTPRRSTNISSSTNSYTLDAPAKPGSMKTSTSSTDIEGEQKRSSVAQNNQRVEEFISITSAKESKAINILRDNNWKLDQSVDAWYNDPSNIPEDKVDSNSLDSLFKSYKGKKQQQLQFYLYICFVY